MTPVYSEWTKYLVQCTVSSGIVSLGIPLKHEAVENRMLVESEAIQLSPNPQLLS